MSFISSSNPSLDFATLGKVKVTTQKELHEIVETAKEAQEIWKKETIETRVKCLREVYNLFDTKREDIAKSITLEMGMPIRQARDEVQYGMTYFAWYLDNAVNYLSPEVTFENQKELHTVYYEPKGVVAAIAPWNYPFSMAIWTCMQALLAGNTVVFKTSKDVILTGKLISDIMSTSSLPAGVWTEVFGDGELGNLLVQEDIDFITFTGSTRVGKNLAKIATEKGIGCVMELGGSAPGIVCADADLDAVMETIYFLRYSNSGQMCDGLKRLIVHKSRYDDIIERFRKLLPTKKVGDASQEDTDVGPLVSANQLAHLEEQYHDALEKGATILAQTRIGNTLKGSYFTPTLLGNISPTMEVWKEEVFGPILPIVTFDDTREAIELANDTRYGLGAYVFTEDVELFHEITHEIESGMVQLNTVNYCIPASPFGGYKDSGIGREHGKWGFHEFCNIKVTSMPKK